MTDARTDVVVIGGGVVGLAVGAALAQTHREVWVIEQHGFLGQETSSRNSGVIHAGIYYPKGSLKARACVRGRELLYRRCEERGIPHRRTGKLIVAADEHELPELRELHAKGTANGARLELIDGADLRRREPLLEGMGAVWSPDTGIVDAHGLMDSYKGDLRDKGGQVVLRTRVNGLERTRDAWRVTTEAPGHGTQTVEATWVVNSAGLEADSVASMAGLDVASLQWKIHYCRGDYYTISPRVPRPSVPLVYPVHHGPGLGIHLTMDMGGKWTAGPDATYIASRDYAVAENKEAEFASAVARYLPSIKPEHLAPDYSGIRPKLAGPGEGFRDFVLSVRPEAPRMVNLIGIESPGLTSAGALAEQVVELVANA